MQRLVYDCGTGQARLEDLAPEEEAAHLAAQDAAGEMRQAHEERAAAQAAARDAIRAKAAADPDGDLATLARALGLA